MSGRAAGEGRSTSPEAPAATTPLVGAAAFGDFSLSVGRVLETLPDAALVADATGRVIAANAGAAALVAAPEAGEARQLEILMARAARDSATFAHRIDLPGDIAGRAFETTLLPFGKADDEANYVLVLARDTTLDRSFTNALIASRRLFQDLVGCFSDFAWETRADGTFNFVSPRGALGFTAGELNGRSARAMLHPDHRFEGPLPFECEVPLEDVEVWMTRADGGPACLVISSIPVVDASGVRVAARGVCRDVTEARERDAALEQARDRERLQGRIIDTMRNEIDPDRMLLVAAESVALALAVRHSWIFETAPDVAPHAAATFTGASEPPPPHAAAIEAALTDLFGAGEPEPAAVAVAGHRLLAIPSNYHGAVNGAICAARLANEAPFGDDERALLAGIAGHIGNAIEQCANHRRLETLSRTDDLTGLLNRRAFAEEVGRRFSHLQRMGRCGALLYVDLDNFKQVNDVHGHQRGDEALVALAEILSGGSRVGDIPARLGGDEFALWLEETDAAAAEAKARTLLEQARSLRAYSGSPDTPLGISIGIALSDPALDESIDELLARADEAMYAVKKGGKGSFALDAASLVRAPVAMERDKC